jgi:xanthine dehydrogenase accessory factor
MICSGEQTVVLIPLDSSMLELVQVLITGLSNHDEIHIELSPKGLVIVDQIQTGKPYFYQNKDSWCYYEKVGFTDYLQIIGGGHVSLALSELAAALDFHVSVYDDREDLHTIQLNHHAHLIEQVDYQQLPAFPQSDRQYMVVMSFGYRTDAQVLRQLYPGKFSYFGLLGSAAKIEVLFNELEQEGFDKNWFSQIDAPAGVKISSQTPMEIAVSIAANLIKARQRLI